MQWSDALIINKSDRVPQADVQQLKRILATLNQDAQQYVTSHGAFDATLLQDVSHRPRATECTDRPRGGIVAVSLHTEHPVSRERFLHCIEDLSDHILRLKGNVAFDSGARFVDRVCHRIEEKEICPRLGQHPTSFTVIGWNLTGEQITSAFEACWNPPAL